MLTFIIPAYNEESHIESLIQSARNYVDQIVVCDDGSTDDTASIAKKSGAVVISHKTNQGYGAAIISLFEYARNNNAQIMITLDGDGQHDPKQIPLLLDTLTRHNVDVVIGSRFLNQNTEAPGYRKRGIKIITDQLQTMAQILKYLIRNQDSEHIQRMQLMQYIQLKKACQCQLRYC